MGRTNVVVGGSGSGFVSKIRDFVLSHRIIVMIIGLVAVSAIGFASYVLLQNRQQEAQITEQVSVSLEASRKEKAEEPKTLQNTRLAELEQLAKNASDDKQKFSYYAQAALLAKDLGSAQAKEYAKMALQLAPKDGDFQTKNKAYLTLLTGIANGK